MHLGRRLGLLVAHGLCEGMPKTGLSVYCDHYPLHGLRIGLIWKRRSTYAYIILHCEGSQSSLTLANAYSERY